MTGPQVRCRQIPWSRTGLSFVWFDPVARMFESLPNGARSLGQSTGVPHDIRSRHPPAVFYQEGARARGRTGSAEKSGLPMPALNEPTPSRHRCLPGESAGAPQRVASRASQPLARLWTPHPVAARFALVRIQKKRETPTRATTELTPTLGRSRPPFEM